MIQPDTTDSENSPAGILISDYSIELKPGIHGAAVGVSSCILVRQLNCCRLNQSVCVHRHTHKSTVTLYISVLNQNNMSLLIVWGNLGDWLAWEYNWILDLILSINYNDFTPYCPPKINARPRSMETKTINNSYRLFIRIWHAIDKNARQNKSEPRMFCCHKFGLFLSP